MFKEYWKTAPLLFLLLTFASCEEQDIDPATRNNIHVIMEFSPVSGQAGTVVVIQGVHFSPNAEENKVYFNGNAKAEVLGSTSNSITTKVPPNAITGKITIVINSNGASTPSEFIIQ